MMRSQQQSGQGMTEYIIIVGLIAVALIVVVAYFGLRSKQTVARSGAALAGSESAVKAETDPSVEVSSSPVGRSAERDASSTAGTSGGGRNAGRAGRSATSVVSGGGGEGKLAPDFKTATRPDPASYEVKEESDVEAIPEAAESDVMAAFSGNADRRGSSRRTSAGGGDGGAVRGFPIGLVALIVLVALGGGLLMVFLARRT